MSDYSWKEMMAVLFSREIKDTDKITSGAHTEISFAAAILAQKHRHLLPPTQVVATSPMCEDDGWPVSVYLVIQFDPIDLCLWHVRDPRSIVMYW